MAQTAFSIKELNIRYLEEKLICPITFVSLCFEVKSKHHNRTSNGRSDPECNLLPFATKAKFLASDGNLDELTAHLIAVNNMRQRILFMVRKFYFHTV